MTDILFAEDDSDIREWVAVALERDTCRIRAVADGAAVSVKMRGHLEMENR